MATPRSLASIVCLMALLAWSAIARAGGPDFQAGNYTSFDKAGKKVCVLNFAQDPQVQTRYLVSGWVGAMIKVPISGVYSTSDNRFKGQWMPIAVGGIRAFAVADLNGEWRADQSEFVIRYPGCPNLRLKFDAGEPDPTTPKLEIKAVDLEPPVAGALLKGRITLSATNLKGSAAAQVWLSVQSKDENTGLVETVAEFSGAGEQVIDLARLPATIPVGADSILVRVNAAMPEAEPTEVRWRGTAKVEAATRPVVLSMFSVDGPTEVSSDHVGDIGWKYSLSGVQGGRAEVTETVTITSMDRPAEVVKCEPIKRVLPCPPEAAAAPTLRLAVKTLSPGGYAAVVKVESPQMQTYNGVIHFFVETPKRDSEANVEPAAISGTAVIAPASIKPKGKTSLAVQYGFDRGPDAVDVDAVFELLDLKGNVTKSIKKRVDLRKGKQAKHNFDLSSDVPGVYTVKVRVSGEKCTTWSTSAMFTVEKPVTTGQVNPPPSPQGNAAQGTYGLVKKVVGRAPEAGDSQYGVLTGNISQNACSFNYATKPPYEGKWEVKATFDTPKSVLKPGEVIELKCSGSGSESGKDLGAMGIGCGWGAEGNCEVIERKKFYIGRASDGKFYSSGDGFTKFKVGTGGKITLTAAQGGLAWGHGGIWDPCTYTYEWNALPTVEAGADPAVKGGEEEEKGATLNSTDPDDEPQKAIHAWLEPAALTLFAGEVSKIVDIHIENFRTDTVDRVEVIFPEKTDNWASLPGQIVVNGGNGSYDPANMGRPVHVDGYFFAARETAPGGDFEIEIIVRQNKAGFERLKLLVHVVPKPRKPQDPGNGPVVTTPPPKPPAPPIGRGWPQGDTSGPPKNFAGRWATSLGAVSLTQQGDVVQGTYEGGVISGTVTGSVLTLRMDERSLSPFTGYGRWILHDSGEEFEGGWTQSASYGPPVRGWTGRRVTTGGASPNVPDPIGAKPTTPVTTVDGKPAVDGGAKPKPGTLDLTPGNFAKNGWTSVGAGASVKVEGDHLVCDVPKASDGAAESFAATPLEGDFDISVDYEHVDWKFSDELSLSWSVFLSPVPHTESRELIQVMRTSGDGGRGFGDIVINASSKAEPVDVPAVTDRTGTLRIARAGNSVRIWQKQGAEWKQAAAFETELPAKLHLGFVVERQGNGSAKVSLTPHPTR